MPIVHLWQEDGRIKKNTNQLHTLSIPIGDNSVIAEEFPDTGSSGISKAFQALCPFVPGVPNSGGYLIHFLGLFLLDHIRLGLIQVPAH